MPARDLTPDEFRQLGARAVDWVASYRESLPSRPVRSPHPPGWVAARLPDTLPEDPLPFDELLRALDDVVAPGSTHWQHPGFHGYFPANSSLASVLGDVFSAGLGPQGMLWSTSPACTEVEQHLMDLLAHAGGLGAAFTHGGGGGGVIQDSASSSTLVALLAALHHCSGGRWIDDGVRGTERVYASTETHSSLAKAARVAGIGARGVRVVGSGVLDPDALAAAIVEDRAAGLVPAMVCATIGTTGTGLVDPVRALAAVCAEHGVWLHVDAAWAGAAMLLPEHAELFDGIELADSYVTDAHKWLLTAFDASLFWTRHGRALPEALSLTPEYLRDPASESGQVADLRDWQVPLGRRFRALKLWTVLHTVGLSGVRAHLREHIGWAADLAARVRATDGVELAAEPSLSLVCLRRVTGDGAAADDAATRALLDRVNADGRVFCSHTVVDGRYVIRVALGSIGTTAADVDTLWSLLAP